MDEGHENVRYAIVEFAIIEYKKALKRKKQADAEALEHWFLSEWGQQLSGGNGQYIIDNVKKELKGIKENGGSKMDKTLYRRF